VKVKAGGKPGGVALAETVAARRRMANGKTTTTTPKTSEISGETEASAMFGNTKQAQNGVKASQEGFTKTVQTTVKRVYYTAGLRTWTFTKESFSLEFRIAAYLLGNSTYDFTQTMDFIYTWGNYGKSSHSTPFLL
jgi:predicted ribonuclease toxin of YeeF-YezG toxin-antitoxin module